MKIITDMPLPMPRSVTSSPIHMITAVPATIVIIMVAMVSTVGCGISGWFTAEQSVPGNRFPERASSTYPADTMTASPTVRYLVYWVILAWPARSWSFRACSRGMTWVSSCTMMLAVM